MRRRAAAANDATIRAFNFALSEDSPNANKNIAVLTGKEP
jgi:hypothetical protein